MEYLDSSILLALLQENKAYIASLDSLFFAIESGKIRVATTLLNLLEVTKLLKRDNWTMDKIADFIGNLLKLKELTIIGTDAVPLNQALQLCKKYDVDLVDAYAVLIMRAHRIKVIYSLDRDFDKFGKEFVRRTEIVVE